MGDLTAGVLDPLRAIVENENVLGDPGELLAYECDGFPIAKAVPTAVVFPRDTGEVARCAKLLHDQNVSIIPRGSGTGLAGGCVAFDGGVIISTARMTQIESIDLDSRVALVQAGVKNRALSDAATDAWASRSDATGGGWHFSPDPSSETVATIGGNAATNAGGINTLKYGVTCLHILGIELVTAQGEVITTRPSGLGDGIGPDLTSLFCGSEGTLGIVTRLWCRLSPTPSAFRTVYAVFNLTDNACRSVSQITAAGIIPSSMEMMDGRMIALVEDTFQYGFPANAAALLLIEIDGPDAGLDDQTNQIIAICRENLATQVKESGDPERRKELWQVRKRAFGTIGRISRSYCTQDACVPRSRLPEVMERIGQIGSDFGLEISSVFHAGDGNVHPILLFDENDPVEVQRVLEASEAILEYCISIGGTITGEHGIGVEKLHLMSKMFAPETIDAFKNLKDTLDPHGAINDGKLVPSERIHIQIMHPTSPNVPGGAL